MLPELSLTLTNLTLHLKMFLVVCCENIIRLGNSRAKNFLFQLSDLGCPQKLKGFFTTMSVTFFLSFLIIVLLQVFALFILSSSPPSFNLPLFFSSLLCLARSSLSQSVQKKGVVHSKSLETVPLFQAVAQRLTEKLE